LSEKRREREASFGSKKRKMEESFVPLRGIKNDLHGRLQCYKQDWTGGFRAGIR
jgi:hypothetical protein